MKLPITRKWLSEKSAREGDADPTTGKPVYIPGFVPSAADRHYDAIISQYAAALAAKDAEIEELKTELHGWNHIDTCPVRESVDLWCVYGGEDFAQYDGGASIGKLVPNRIKSEEYGFFGNQSNYGIPQRDAPDLKPVAWRKAVPYCPATLIAEVLGVPVTLEDALKGYAQ